MATVMNDRDVLLLGITQRDVNSQDATILITSDSPTFHVSATGTTTPSYITVTAHLLNIIGTASFTAAGATITDNGDNTATIAYNGMSGSSAVITASVTRNGSTYNASTTLTKVVDGSAGQAGSSAAWVEISTFGGQVFSRPTATSAFTPTSIVLNATPYGNNATSFQWQYWDGSAWTNISGATSATYEVASGDFTSSRNYRVQATIDGSVYVDEMTIVQVTGGTNSVSGFLTNQSITLAAATDGTVGSYASATGTFKVYDGITDKTGASVTYSVASQNNCTITINTSGVYSITVMAADTASAVLQAVYNGVTIPLTVTLAKSKTGTAGTPANQYATAYLYQWAATVPANPTGTSNYNWSTGANTGYVTGDGWSTTVPTNPGTANLSLFVAIAQIVAASGTTSSSVSYSSATVQAWTKNGATGPQGDSGVQSASTAVYQWAASIPASPSGTATYTWSNRAVSSFPSGWSSSAGVSPTPGMTLWEAKVYLVDSATATQTSFNWTSASVSSVGYAGSNGNTGQQGASYVTAYCASATATTTTTPAQTTGNTSLPATNDGGITGTWSSTVPSLTSGQYLYQSDGIYDPITNKVTWSIPYWSSLKVGSLNSVSENTGNLTVSGTISSANGNFVVDASGGVTMKSATIYNPDGSILLAAGTQLNPANAAPGTLNADIVVGGRNLLQDSGFERGQHPCSETSGSVSSATQTGGVIDTGATSPYVGSKFLFFDSDPTGGAEVDAYLYLGGPLAQVTPGKAYTLSFYYKSAGGITNTSTFWRLSNGTHIGGADFGVVFGNQDSWTKASLVWTCPSGVTTIEPRFGFHCTTYAWMAVDAIQIEEGNKGTAWTPAPEDTSADISIASTTSTWIGVSGTGRPADNASSDLVLIGRGVTVTGNSAAKNVADGWSNADVYSVDSFTGGAYASAVAGEASTSLMFGLNSDPTSDSSYASIDYAIYLAAGTLAVYESGVNKAPSLGAYAAGDVFAVVYDGSSVKYLKNGVVVYTSTSANASVPNQTLFFDSSLNSSNATLKNIRFGPLSSNNWANIGNRPADDQIKNNLTDLSWWAKGATIPWTLNDETNAIVDAMGDIGVLGPKGVNEAVWLATETANNGGSGGGWNLAPLVLDPTKTYRFVIPIRKLSGSATAYWGINEGTTCTLNTTTAVSNPYFANMSISTTDRWYLFVGYIYPAGSTGNTNDNAGVWDCMTRQKVASGTNYNFKVGITSHTHRAYQYYASNGAQQVFGRPMVNLVDGSEPSLEAYFGGPVLGQNVGGQITSSNSSTLIGTGAINSVHISDLRTTNYAEDGSGNPTAGAKLASTGTALKVEKNSFQIGTLVLNDYWFRLVQGIDGSVTSNRIIWRGNNDATTRGGAPNIACLTVVPTLSVPISDYSASEFFQLAYHTYTLTPTTYSTNTDNLDAVQQIHVQFFTSLTDTAPFTEFYQPCPSRTYDAASGIVKGSWHWGWKYAGGVNPNAALITSTNPRVYNGYLRVRIANTYGWSATQDFDRGVSAGTSLGHTTITGVAGSSGGGSGASGGACPAPWVKVKLLSGKEVNASDLHNGAKLAAVNDNNMQPLPQGGTVRDLTTIWAQRYRVKLTNGAATEWSENHRFAVVDRGWVTVQNLRAGDQIMGLQESIVESVLAVGEGQVVSFRVEGAGTYFAGGLLCHNTKASF
jgi:hypothetical protein